MRHEIRGYAHSVVTLLRRMMAADPSSVLDSKWLVTCPFFVGFGCEELFDGVGTGDAVVVTGRRIVEQMACLDEDEGEGCIYRIRNFIDLEIWFDDQDALVLNAVHEEDADFFFSFFRGSLVKRFKDKKVEEKASASSQVHHLIDVVREIGRLESLHPSERVEGALWKVEASEVELYCSTFLIQNDGFVTQSNLLRFLALVKQPHHFKAIRHDPQTGASDFLIEADGTEIRITGLREGNLYRYVVGSIAATNMESNRTCFW